MLKHFSFFQKPQSNGHVVTVETQGASVPKTPSPKPVRSGKPPAVEQGEVVKDKPKVGQLAGSAH